MEGKEHRKYDVVILGSTGFVGKLIVEYFARNFSGESQAQDKCLQWAIAGRNKTKLEQVRRETIGKFPQIKPTEEAKEPFEILLVDIHRQDEVDGVVAKSRVIINAVGPYTKHGTPVVDSCVRLGTDYCDLSGELPWIRKMINTYHDEARQKGVKIVPACGFDSVPSDLGTLFLVDYVQKQHHRHVEWIHSFVEFQGGLSGGTYASLMEAFNNPRKASKAYTHPYYLNPKDHPNYRQPASWLSSEQKFLAYDKHATSWTAPFLIGNHNARVVRRSNALLGDRYGDHFEYSEAAATKSLFGALLATIFFFVMFVMLRITFMRNNVLSRFTPKSGTGPSEETRQRSWFRLRLLARTLDDKGQNPMVVRCLVNGGDPGYNETAKMISETAFILAKQRNELEADPYSLRGGILTPATAVGMTLVRRLQNVGLGFTITNTEGTAVSDKGKEKASGEMETTISKRKATKTQR